MINKKYFLSLSLILCASFSVYAFDPWGIWDYEPIDVSIAPKIELSCGTYYHAWGHTSYMGISKDGQGIVAGVYNFPMFGSDGAFYRITKYEKTDYGFRFYLVGTGIKHFALGKKPEFKENVCLAVDMIFKGENECVFRYVSRFDSDGFSHLFMVKENILYRRIKVDTSVSDNTK